MGSKIMVVISDTSTLNLCKLILKVLGHEATTVSEGKIALTSCQETRFDLLVCDLDSHGLTGPKLLEAMRAEKFAGKAIAIRSPGGTKESILLAKGFSQVLTKSFENQNLVDAVNQVLGLE